MAKMFKCQTGESLEFSGKGNYNRKTAKAFQSVKVSISGQKKNEMLF